MVSREQRQLLHQQVSHVVQLADFGAGVQHFLQVQHEGAVNHFTIL